MNQLMFFLQNAGLGVGLAMDAFSVSMANGLNDPCMKRRRHLGIAALFALFQGVMPLIGWFCVHTVAEAFTAFKVFIPWIALILLVFIGGKMLLDGIKECRAGGCDCECNCEEQNTAGVGFWALVVQGIATSIDALSVGFTISEYGFAEALLAVLIIAAVTLVICFAGVWIGKKFGTALAGRATILGGGILILIGICIFVKGMME